MNTIPHTNHLSCLSHRVLPCHLYICREPSTNQLLFMQNKLNFKDAKMNVNIYYTKAYENIIPLAGQKNKPNSNPISKGQNELKIACQKIWPHPWQTAFGGLYRVLKHKKSRPRCGGNNWSSCVSAVFFSHYRPLLPRDNCIYCILSLALTIKELVCFFQAENKRYDTPRNRSVVKMAFEAL